MCLSKKKDKSKVVWRHKRYKKHSRYKGCPKSPYTLFLADILDLAKKNTQKNVFFWRFLRFLPIHGNFSVLNEIYFCVFCLYMGILFNNDAAEKVRVHFYTFFFRPTIFRVLIGKFFLYRCNTYILEGLKYKRTEKYLHTSGT